jgi:hypothetical protein
MTSRLLKVVGPVSLILVVGGCASVPGGTGASPTLQRDTLQMILLLDSAADKNCHQRRIANTEIIKMPTAENKTVVERWTLDRCGKPIPYRVTFTPSPRGGTDFGVQQER